MYNTQKKCFGASGETKKTGSPRCSSTRFRFPHLFWAEQPLAFAKHEMIQAFAGSV